SIPLMLECGPFAGKGLRQALHDVGDERIRLLDGRARLVDECRLNVGPAPTKSFGFIVSKQRMRRPVGPRGRLWLAVDDLRLIGARGVVRFAGTGQLRRVQIGCHWCLLVSSESECVAGGAAGVEASAVPSRS